MRGSTRGIIKLHVILILLHTTGVIVSGRLQNVNLVKGCSLVKRRVGLKRDINIQKEKKEISS